MTARRNRRHTAKRNPSRRLHHQTLERRELLAGDIGVNDDGPRLISVSANSGENFRLNDNNVLSVAPNELTFRFRGGQQLDPDTFPAFRFLAAGGDGSFADELDDQGNVVRGSREITPGHIGFQDREGTRIVVARFAETLANDQYLIDIAGYDDTNAGIVGLRNADGDLFVPSDPSDPARPSEQIRFRLELGPQVAAVVPQPITGSGASRVQQRDRIHVHFNDDPLSNPAAGVIRTGESTASVVQPRFYNLFFTADTVENTDDVAHTPVSVEYDPALNRAVLTFDDDLSEFAPDGAGTFRLRVGSSQSLPGAPSEVNADADDDAGDTFSSAHDLAVNFAGEPDSILISGEIEPTSNYPNRWPGIDAPGTRDNRRDPQVTGQPDSTPGINRYYYNFAEIYGLDPANNELSNAITDAQKRRTREILALYGQQLGVEFVESEDRGLQIVTGDIRAIVRTAQTGRGEPLQAFRLNDEDPTRGLLILDAGEDWYDGYGLSPDPDQQPSWFVEALRGVGSLLGIGNTFDQVPGVASGSNPDLYAPELFPLDNGSVPAEFSIEPDFLSTSDIVPGQALHRPETRDVDLYRFEVAEAGRVAIETFAQRLDESSLLDTEVRLWKWNPSSDAYDLVSRNDDYYGDDSIVSVDVSPYADGTPARYVVGVTASGNEGYNADIDESGLGGRSQGEYQMRITFQNRNVDTIRDTRGTPLDGDGDGRAGGDFHFWFRTARPKGQAAAGEPRTLFVDKTGSNASASGTLASPYRTIDYAFDEAEPGDVVRILPSGGGDGRVGTVGDNLAYELGRGGSGNAVLSDGENFNVPRGVTVMIDAGAIFKLRNAKISVGSEAVDENRSLAALQVLGTPTLVDHNGDTVDGDVVFTSYQDESFAVDTNPLPTNPAAGQWAGIEFRNDVDRSEGRPVWETEGIFLDYVAHADLRYGGGSIGTNEPIVTPLQMLQARPTLIGNTIRFSSDAAISADPDSFEETNFHAPLYQRADAFTSDYDRVGPDIRGNTLRDNSINGLFVRVETPATGEREPMTVSGRFDDADIVHVLSEVLVLQGQPGGPLALEQRPDVLSVTVNAPTGTPPIGPPPTGSLTEGETVDYRVTFVTSAGTESLASEATRAATVGPNRNLRLANLPEATETFAGRRLYRLDPATGDYVFVTQLDRNTTTYLDDGSTRGGRLADAALADERLLPRFDARLSIDPGLILKLDSARIETGIGADFYAEGNDGNPIVFTSRLDDEFGGGGTFDTNNDGDAGTPAPAAWAGLVFRQGSSASLDHTVVRYAGGESSVSGGFVNFNPVEILQADVRIANSLFSDNAGGENGSFDTRDGIGFNGDATIFVRGAQPVIVGNTIRDNLGAAISINPDALNHPEVRDRGRGTEGVDRFEGSRDNQGPLIAENRLDRNDLNGMLVRNEALTTESVWDDTDIVHVVERFVYAWNHHHRSGLRLKSDADESLVVKFQDGGAIVADRYLNDVEDSIGGTLQVIGQPGFPVILTSLQDDTVGAGFTPAGMPQNDTDHADDSPSPGDWYGIVFRAGANDRNVAYVLENEPAIPESAGLNAIPTDAQNLGSLARGETNSDNNRRLGFNVRGTLSQNGDVDVYEFSANGQTEVFLDIDDTRFGLDTIVELVDRNGNIQALSNRSDLESNDPGLLVNNLSEGAVLPLHQTGQRVSEGPNPLDAGMRVVLSGNSSSVNEYFVRVRSSNIGADYTGDPNDRLTDPNAVGQGLSRGQYQLSIRLREQDEIAGSTVRLADIRYATNAIDVPATPFDSPLAAEHAERLQLSGVDVDGSGSFTNGGAQNLGSLNESHRRVLRVSGVLGNNVADPATVAAGQDIDVYRVDLFDDDQEPNIIGENRFVSAVFDLDYADQLGRANTRLSVFDSAGRLILHGLDSNVADDQGRPRLGNDMQNLDAGSAGTLDSFIGPVELQVGTYYLVVSSAQMTPEVLTQYFNANPADTNIRMLPVDSVRRLAEEGFSDSILGVDRYIPLANSQRFNTTSELPNVVPLFDETSIVPYSLEDVRMFLTLQNGLTGSNRSTIVSVDPFTGQLERTIGEFGQPVGDLGMRRDGELFSYSLGPQNGGRNAGNTGNYLNISSIDGSANNLGDDGLTFQRNNQDQNNTENDPNGQFLVNAMAFVPQGPNSGASVGNVPGISGGERLLVVGNRDNSGRGGEVIPELRQNVVYSMVANGGAATNRGSTNGDLDRDFGAVETTFIEPYGPGSNKQELGIVDVGQFIDSDPEKTGGEITGIARNQNVPGFFGSILFGVTDEGGLYSFNPNDRRFLDVSDDVPASYNRVINTTFHGTVERHEEHFGFGAPEFSSLTLGPRATESGRYNSVFFATTTDGWLYAFQVDAAGVVEPAPVMVNGRTAVRLITAFGGNGTGGRQVTGVAFSIREENPWHQTGDRNVPFGVGGPNSPSNLHGVFRPHNQTRNRISGGSSLYFGFEPTGSVGDNKLNDDGGTGNLAPGGVHGSTVSAPFSLEGYAGADNPTLYFNYFLEVQGDSDYAPGRQQLDSFRVFASGDDGQWQMLSTNNSFRSFVNGDEYDYFADTEIPVQELHENTDVWRQARIDLSPLAGQKNVQLRFDFSSAGGMQNQFRTTGYLTEIQAVPGREIVDGTTFTLSEQFVGSNQFASTFEFVRGAAFNIPDGDAILEGQQINVVGPAGNTLLTLTTGTPGGPNQVEFERSESGAEIAESIAAALQTLDPELEAFSDGVQVRLPEADSFSLSPERFAAASVTIPDDLQSLVDQTIRFTNEIGVETPITFRTSQELSFTSGGETVTVTPTLTAAADGVQIRFIDRESFGDNPAQATYDFFERVITVEFNSQAATPENANVAAVVAAIDGLGQFNAAVTAGDETRPFVRPTGVVAFSENDYFFDPDNDSAAGVAADLAGRINGQLPRLTANADAAELIVFGAAAVDLDPAFLAIPNPTSFNAGMPDAQTLANGNVPVFYNPSMTDTEVRDSIRGSLAVGIGLRDPITGMTSATQEHFPGYGTNRIRVFEQALAGNSSAVGFSTFLPGDEFGSFGSTQVSNSATRGRLTRHGALSNNVEGVYIDDIVVGFASRGEVVLNAPAGNRNFTIDPAYRELRTQGSHQPEFPNEILVGGYTLETRGGAEYGVPKDYDPIRLGLDEQLGWGRSFGVNERFNSGAVTLNVPPGRDLTDGETLVISNGTRGVTFEFDSDGSVAPGHVRVPFIPVMSGLAFDNLTDEPAEVARSLRDAINSPQARNVLGITAAGGDSRELSGMTGDRVELFGEEIRINPSSGRFLKVDMVAQETPYGRETARTLPIADQDDATVVRDVSPNEFARATVTEYVNGQTDTLLAKGKIGDTVITGDANELIPTDPMNDRDIVKVFLRGGDTIDVEVDSVGWNRGVPFRTPRAQIFSDGETPTRLADSLTFDPFDRFDPNNPFGFVNSVPPAEIEIESTIDGFVAPSDGYYYVAVSSAAAGVVFGDPTFLIGQYQLKIRPSGQVGSEPVVAEYHLEAGDTNVDRAQGQLVIDSNFISDFSGTGVRATYSGDQIPGRTTQSPLQLGPVGTALLRNQNSDRLLPGTVISNNVIAATAGTGIEFSGINPAGGQAPPPVPFGRIVNNTVVGPGSGTGIDVTNGTSPTVLNNVVSGFNVGLNVAGNSASTVSNGNAFHDNNTPSNRPLGSQSFVIPASEEVFQDASRRIFIPAAESRIIDSSFANLNDRSAFFNTVKAPVGISASPIFAPEVDAYGIPRVDDPDVTTPGGVGGNVFIDRGGIDRADFDQPSALLVSPVDFIADQGAQVAGGDNDPDASFVQLPPNSAAVPFFEIQLLDPAGTGPDVTTITEETVILTENGVTLTPGVDYTFGYSDNSRLIRLTPLAGLWRPDAVYEVTLNNKDRVVLTLPRGDQIDDGDQYVITDSDDRQSVFEFDSGYVMQIPQTLGIQVLGPNTFFRDGDAFRITSPGGTSQTFEINLSGAVASGNIEVDLAAAGTVQEIRDVILAVLEEHADELDLRPRALGSNAVQIGSLAGHTIENAVDGLDYFGTDAGVEAGQQFRYRTDSQDVLFEFDVDGSGVSAEALPVSIERTNTVDEIAEAIAAAVVAEQLGLVSPRAIGDGRVLLGGTPDDVLTVDASVLTLVGQPGVTGPLTLTVPSDASAAALDGETFSIENGDVRVDFVFTTDPNLQTPNRRVVLAGGASPTQIATRIAEEIRAGFTGDLPATAAGRVVTLAEQPAVIPAGSEQILARVNPETSTLVVDGVSGGAIPVPFIPSQQFAPSAAAAALTAAIASSPLDVTMVTPGGGTLLFSDTERIELQTADGALSVIGEPLPAVSDLAGNPVESNRDNDETRFTIIMPEIEFDFGDAPDSYGTLRASNGARHTISSERTPRLGVHVDTEPDGSPFPDSDDAPLPIVPSESGGVFTFDVSADGVLRIAANGAVPVGGETLTLEIGTEITTFELVDPSANPNPGNVPVVLNDDDTPEVLLRRLADVLRPRLDATGGGVLLSFDAGDPASIVLDPIDDEDGISIGTFTVDGTAYRVFTEPGTDPDNVPPEAILGFLNPLDPSGTTVPVTVTGSGLVNAWIDFNRDGVFDEDEQVMRNEVVVDGMNRLQIFAPDDAPEGDTWARFRISDSGNLGPSGVAVGGEVEDYLVSVFRVPSPTAVDDDYATNEDTPLIVDAAPERLIDNDLDLDGQILPPRVFVIDTPSNGTLTITDPFEGTFEYVPDPDFNGIDTFTYLLSSQASVGDGADVGNVATVTIDVAAVNDPPVFDIVDEFDVLERDDETPTVIAEFITNAFPGPPTATDEIAAQEVVFGIDDDQSDIPPGLFVQDPVVDEQGQLVFTQAADQFGTATLVVTVADNDPTDPQLVRTTVTLHVRPVNDPPRPETDRFGESDFADPDDGYVVADGDDGLVPPDQQPDLGRTAGTILYTTKEDEAAFFIPLRRPDGGIGFHRIGLLDVFNVGPENESADLPGGSQELSISSVPTTTARGGTLAEVRDNGALVGYHYTPPTDFNREIGIDFFTYEVIDDNPDDGETWSLDDGELVDDRRTVSGTVELLINPVNDRPQFILSTDRLTAAEDTASLVVENFATDIFAGPPLTAFDEIDPVTGQSVEFTVSSLSFPEAESSQFFDVYPTITPEGTLTYKPAADVFGNFEFEVVLTDDGPDNSVRGDQVSSEPQRLTIEINPINDPPRLIDGEPPLEFTLLEDNSVEIPVRGDAATRGLLDIFTVGPANELADILPEPGGNQTLRLASPIPASTAGGGKLTPNVVAGEIVSLTYTPRANFNGIDSFIFSVIDDGVTVDLAGNVINDPRRSFATVTLDVTPVNDPPQFSGAGAVTSPEDAGSVEIPNWATNVQAGPPGAIDEIEGTETRPAQDLTFVIEPVAQPGSDEYDRVLALFEELPTADVVGNTATLRYRSADNQNGQAAFRVRLLDDGGTANGGGDASGFRTFTIGVDAVNDPPEFTPGGAVTVDEDSGPYNEAWASEVRPGPENAFDEANQDVAFDVVTPTEYEDLFAVPPRIDENGVLTFTPAENAAGEALVEVTAIDSDGGTSDTVTLEIVISDINDPPVAVDDAFETDEDTTIVLPSTSILANDIDPDLATNPNEFLTIVLDETFTSQRGAAVSYDPLTGEVTYDPTASASLQSLGPNESATDTFVYRVVDSEGVLSNPATIEIDVDGVNDAPFVVDDVATLNQTGSTTLRVLDNDFDVDGSIDPNSLRISLLPAFGAVSIGTGGTLVYTPFSQFSGQDQFAYTVADNLGLRSEEAVVRVSFNAPPVAGNDGAITIRDQSVEIDVAANDSDPDGTLNLNSVQIVGGPARGQAVPLGDGRVRYIPDPGFVGNDAFSYSIRDNEGQVSNVANVTVRVVASAGQNPVIATDVNADSFTTAIDALLIVNKLSRDLGIGQSSIPVDPSDPTPPYYDVNGDARISSLDALLVINALARQSGGGEGERDGARELTGDSDPAPIAPPASVATVETAASFWDHDSVPPLDPPARSKSTADAWADDAFELDSAADDLIDSVANGREKAADDGESVAAIDEALLLFD